MISQTLTSVPISQREIWDLREEDAAERWELRMMMQREMSYSEDVERNGSL
jgi:hypothetical protein